MNLRARRPAAFTLLEMLLVLGLVVLMAAIAWPALRGPLAASRLREGARRVRIELARARLAAIQSGEPQELRFEPEGVRLRRGRFGPPLVSNFAQEGAQPAMPEVTVPVERWTEAELPSGVAFAQPVDGAASAETAAVQPWIEQSDVEDDEPAGVGEQPVAWSQPIVLWPDGSTTTHTFVLEGAQWQMSLELDGLTGVVHVHEAERRETSL